MPLHRFLTNQSLKWPPLVVTLLRRRTPLPSYTKRPFLFSSKFFTEPSSSFLSSIASLSDGAKTQAFTAAVVIPATITMLPHSNLPTHRTKATMTPLNRVNSLPRDPKSKSLEIKASDSKSSAESASNSPTNYRVQTLPILERKILRQFRDQKSPVAAVRRRIKQKSQGLLQSKLQIDANVEQ
ncbi:hypothetical protein SDJN03_29447, partial [Cucurbita argyrosperma subsp. sororia]